MQSADLLHSLQIPLISSGFTQKNTMYSSATKTNDFSHSAFICKLVAVRLHWGPREGLHCGRTKHILQQNQSNQSTGPQWLSGRGKQRKYRLFNYVVKYESRENK